MSTERHLNGETSVKHNFCYSSTWQ